MENKVINEIKKLKTEISPRPEWVALSRDVLLQQINSNHQYQKTSVGIAGFWSVFNQSFRQRMFEPAVMMLLILGSFVGGSLTINAAFYSLPGDGLYRVKLALEKTHVALVTDEKKKMELKMEFASNRVAEFDKIVAQSDVSAEAKKKKIETVVKEFKINVTDVNSHLSKINQAGQELDNDVTVKMALTVSEKTEELAKNIDKTAGNLEGTDKQELEEIFADAVQSVHNVNLAAQQVINEANDSATTTPALEEGVVEGVSNEADADPQDQTVGEVEANQNSQTENETGTSQAEDGVSPVEPADN